MIRVPERFRPALRYAMVAALAGVVFLQLWSSRVAASLRQAEQTLQSIAADVSATTHAAVSHARILQTEASRQLREACVDCRRPPSPQLASLVPGPGGGWYTTRDLPPEVPRETASYLFGKGAVPPRGSEAAAEIDAVLRLDGLMREVRRNIPEVQWVYYTSENRFTNMSPFEGRQMADSVAWSDEFLSHPLYVETAPAKNPARQVRWHEAYIDQAGKGLLTSVLAPVYDGQERFRGILGLDLTLDTLTGYLTGPGIDIGTPLIVTKTGQVIAHPTATRSSDKDVKRLEEVLPYALVPAAARLRALSAGTPLEERGWRVYAVDIQEAPWRLMFLVDSNRLALQALAGMGPEIVGLVLLLLLLVGLERRRRITESLRESEARYARVLEGSDQGFWDWNLKTRKFTVSPRFEMMFGYAPGDRELGPDAWHELVHPEDLPRALAAIDQHLAGVTPLFRVEMRMRTKSGGWQWVLTRGKLVEREPNGLPLMMAGTQTDVSERKNAEVELIAAKQAAEAADAAKSRFLAAASHDLRQPLQAINLFNAALAKTALSDPQRQIAQKLATATKSLGELLDALLDVSKLDAGVVTPQLVQVDLYDLFRRIENEFASVAQSRRLRFKLFFPSQPCVVETDPHLMLGIIRNLVGNAIKYTRQGGVLVAARLRREHLLLQVWDTGIGIEAQHLPRIFDEFFQVHNPQRDRSSGLGLGLAIVERMVRLMGYTVACRSQPGRGTVMEVRVPCARIRLVDISTPAAPEPAEPGDLQALPVRRLALIEDDGLVAEALGVWLGLHGIELQVFGSGEAALADPRILEADFFVTDFRLPGGMSGIDLLNRLQDRTPRPLKALVVTGDTSAERVDAFAATRWTVLYKPITPERLLAAIVELSAGARAPESAAAVAGD